MSIKLCVEADSFRTSEKDFAYSVKKASELGFKYIEPEMMTGRCLLNIYGYCNITSLEDDPMEMRKLIESHGLKVPCLSTHSNLLNTEYGVDYLKKAIRFAYILGAPIVNTAEGPKPEWMTDEDAFRIMGYNLKTILEMAENYDITITIEPHGVYTTNAEGLLKIMDLSDSKYLAINFDTGNVTIAGNDAYETLSAVIDHVVHVHFKDVKRPETTEETGVVTGVAVGDGDVDIKGCIRLLKEHDYDGYVSLECANIEMLKKSIKYLEPLIP